MKPPVEAPTSRQTSPAGSIPKASSAAASLWPPRLTYGSGAATSTGVVRRRRGRRACDRAGRRRPPPPRPCRPARAPGPAARFGQAALDEQLVEPDARGPGCRRRGSPAYRGTARCTGTHPIGARPAPVRRGRAAVSRPATSDRPGVARSVASVSRTCSGEPRRVEPEHAPQVRHRPVVDEPVARDADDPHGDVAVGRVGQARLLEQLEDAAAEAAGDDALLERHDQALAAGLVEDQLAVERPGEAGVDDADRPALAPRARRPPRAPARRSARSRRTAGRGPRAGPRRARPG